MKRRGLYLSQLIDFQDKPLIKVITGMRGCGKSTLLVLFEQHLQNQGVPGDAIISMNFESSALEHIRSYKELYRVVDERIHKNRRIYILLDEVQRVDAWERAVDSLLAKRSVDIYITGSCSNLLSSEMSMLLSGRYVEIRMFPLSFREFLDFTGDGNVKEQFQQYLQFGSLPVISELLDRPTIIPDFLMGIYNTVIVKDVLQHGNVRDVLLLENVMRCLAQNIGRPVSARKIRSYLTSTGHKVAVETINNYLSILENAFIIYKIRRYDIKQKMHLKTLEKYYIADTGVLNCLLGCWDAGYGHMLENVVYLELLRRGYSVSVGKIGILEVDFVAEKEECKVYFQVAATIADEAVRKRKLQPLLKINDNYEKTILSMDENFIEDYEGIRSANIINFLLEEE